MPSAHGFAIKAAWNSWTSYLPWQLRASVTFLRLSPKDIDQEGKNMDRLSGALILVLATIVAAPAIGEEEPKPKDQQQGQLVRMSPEQVVAARRASYFLSTQAIGQIKAGIDEGGDLRRTVSAAKMLANWAGVLPTMFPEGSNIETSRALDTVWSDREGFEARAAAYREAALHLAETASQGDREAAQAAFMDMAGTCHACHTTYREE